MGAPPLWSSHLPGAPFLVPPRGAFGSNIGIWGVGPNHSVHSTECCVKEIKSESQNITTPLKPPASGTDTRSVAALGGRVVVKGPLLTVSLCMV